MAVITVSIRQVRIVPVLVNAGRRGSDRPQIYRLPAPDIFGRLGNLSSFRPAADLQTTARTRAHHLPTRHWVGRWCLENVCGAAGLGGFVGAWT